MVGLNPWSASWLSYFQKIDSIFHSLPSKQKMANRATSSAAKKAKFAEPAASAAKRRTDVHDEEEEEDDLDEDDEMSQDNGEEGEEEEELQDFECWADQAIFIRMGKCRQSYSATRDTVPSAGQSNLEELRRNGQKFLHLGHVTAAPRGSAAPPSAPLSSGWMHTVPPAEAAPLRTRDWCLRSREIFFFFCARRRDGTVASHGSATSSALQFF